MKIQQLLFNLILFVTLFWWQQGHAQTYSKEKSVTRSFKIMQGTEIEVNNKYGNITVVPWNKDSVRFEIKVKVVSQKEMKTSETLDYIDFDFKANNYYVIAQTIFPGKGTFWNDVSDVANNLFTTVKTSIDYTIYLPETNTLKLENKYGNLFMTDFSGKLNINLSNGDLKANQFSGPTSIISEYSTLNIEMINSGSLELSYGELYLTKANVFTIIGKSSELHIEQAGQLTLNSKRDKIFLTSVSSLFGETYFSNLKLDELINSINLNMKYGNIEITGISFQAKSFLINASDTDIRLNFAQEMKYNLDMTVNEKTQVLYSANINNIKTTQLAGSEKLIQVQCAIGKGAQKPLPVKLNVSAGNVSLKLN